MVAELLSEGLLVCPLGENLGSVALHAEDEL